MVHRSRENHLTVLEPVLRETVRIFKWMDNCNGAFFDRIRAETT